MDSRSVDSENSEKCGFCKTMRQGPCADVYIIWEACYEKNKERPEIMCGDDMKKIKSCLASHPEFKKMIQQNI